MNNSGASYGANLNEFILRIVQNKNTLAVCCGYCCSFFFCCVLHFALSIGLGSEWAYKHNKKIFKWKTPVTTNSSDDDEDPISPRLAQAMSGILRSHPLWPHKYKNAICRRQAAATVARRQRNRIHPNKSPCEICARILLFEVNSILTMMHKIASDRNNKNRQAKRLINKDKILE